ncbi:MAG: L-rhamnose isomerase [Verrucomicrobiae bacterium]|nr:L-rhamnose isomerase [Verrucomicrobiae bacterium]
MKTFSDSRIEKVFQFAKETYATHGVDVDAALKTLSSIPVSLHCWQGDDVTGFENKEGLSGGIQATGNYPGKARNGDELRQDLELVLKLAPGKKRLNLHSIYAETGVKKVDRAKLQPEHFAGWMDWAKARGIGLDFNGSFFSHPKAASGFTLSSRDAAIRDYWVEHAISCRKIGEAMGRKQGSPCVTNIWIPDGFKDIPVDRKTPREILRQSLDRILAEKIDSRYLLDAVEPKLFGIGSESCVIGSHEFYLAYAVEKKILLCLDAGHYHPTETIADKISSSLIFLDEILLHVSRGVRWDSDHVVILNDDLLAIAAEIVRGGFLDRVHIGLDFFDASINRLAAWTIGVRCMQKALLAALLEPADLRRREVEGDYTGRLAMLEELKTLPLGAIWDYHCLQHQAPAGPAWLDEVRAYEQKVLSKR